MAAIDLKDVKESLITVKDSLSFGVADGGEGSGNHGHKGRPGKVGGSSPDGSGGGASDPTVARGKGLAVQKMYGGEANHSGVGNGSKGKIKKLKSGTGVTKVSRADLEYSKGPDSIEQYLNDDDTLMPEREALHDEIIRKHLRGVVKPDGQPVFVMMGGGPAAGKSSILEDGHFEVPDKFNAVHINADDVKREIPEYEEMVSRGDKDAAAYAHEESSALVKRVSGVAYENGYNTVLDGTGDNSVKSVEKKINEARAAGMKIVGCYVTCPTEDAVFRNEQRYIKTNRFVPPEVVRETHRGVSRILPQVAHLFDEVKLYDTTVKGKPVLIAESTYGKPMKVLNQGLYDKFLAKANEVYAHDR